MLACHGVRLGVGTVIVVGNDTLGNNEFGLLVRIGTIAAQVAVVSLDDCGASHGTLKHVLLGESDRVHKVVRVGFGVSDTDKGLHDGGGSEGHARTAICLVLDIDHASLISPVDLASLVGTKEASLVETTDAGVKVLAKHANIVTRAILDVTEQFHVILVLDVSKEVDSELDVSASLLGGIVELLDVLTGLDELLFVLHHHFSGLVVLVVVGSPLEELLVHLSVLIPLLLLPDLHASPLVNALLSIDEDGGEERNREKFVSHFC